MPLDIDKLSNIIGTKLPYWVLNQLRTRSQKNSKAVRDNANLVYLANKSSWVRLVSSVNISKNDIEYFQNLGANIQDETSLAKEFVLFGGTSKYLNKQSYQLRGGFNDTYAILGKTETQKYGYRPMPGITNVDIQTQGRLGSIRMATVNFKCWDKDQLDIIDALYFKLGFTMFLEWGHTFFYPSENPIGTQQKLDPNKLQSTELYSIDPFDDALKGNKEEIFRRIAVNNRETEGNYDAMLGIVTNFNFSLNQEGGYDCSIKIIGLGVLGDSIKANKASDFQTFLKEQVIQYTSTLERIKKAKESEQEKKSREEEAQRKKRIETIAAVIKTLDSNGIIRNPNSKNNGSSYKSWREVNSVTDAEDAEARKLIQTKVEESSLESTKKAAIDKNQVTKDYFNDKNIRFSGGDLGTIIYIDKLNAYLPAENVLDKKIFIKLNGEILKSTFNATNILNAKQSEWKEIRQFAQSGKDIYRIEKNYGLFNGNISSGTFADKRSATIAIGHTAALPDSEGIFDKQKIQNELSIKGYEIAAGETFDKSYSISINNDDNPFTTATRAGFSVEFNDEKIVNVIKDAVNKIDFNEAQFQLEEALLSNGAFKLSAVLKKAIKVKIPGTIEVDNLINTKNRTEKVEFKKYISDIEYNLDLRIEFEDLNLIKSFTTSDKRFSSGEVPQNLKKEEPKTQSQTASQTASTQQTESPNYYVSSLQLALRIIQVHSLSKAIDRSDLDLDLLVQKIDLWNDNGSRSFITQLFSNGIYQDCITGLIDGSIDDSNYDEAQNQDVESRFKIHAKYGFATNLMAGNSPLYNQVTIPTSVGASSSGFNTIKTPLFTSVNYQKLLTSYVLPYEINQEIEGGTPVNHPVYIPFGLFLMLLNHNCTLYGKKPFSTPLVYLDYNPNHNFCLSNTKQLSTDPFVCLIPFNGTNEDFKNLISSKVVLANPDGSYYIAPVSGSQEINRIFTPESNDPNLGDNISGGLLEFKFKEGEDLFNPYRGVLMNILLNIDYLVQVVKDFSLKDGENKVYLKPLIEQVLLDVNKSLGNINMLRLSYNDKGNVFQIVDDQIMPPISGEFPLDNKTADAQLPLFGLNSIAKNLEIKTEISSRLSNMIAVSANANVGAKASSSEQGDTVGYINYDYIDRYVPDRVGANDKQKALVELNAVLNDPNKTKEQKNEALLKALQTDLLDSEKNAAIQFNSAIRSFYNTNRPSKDQVSSATNYYMDRMNNLKGNEEATRAAAMIPLSVNFTTDGMSGLNMYQSFTVPEEILPYTYSTRKNINGTSDLKKVGFVIVGLNHSIQNNIWETSVRANMIFLKDQNVYKLQEYKKKIAGAVAAVPGSGSPYHGDLTDLNKASRTPRGTGRSTSANASKTSTYLFGTKQNIDNSVKQKAHGPREPGQVGQWQSSNAWDLFVPAFTPIYAIFNGSINNINYLEQGNFIWGYRFTLIGSNNSAWYTHLDRVIVTEGQQVKKGDLLGYVGDPPRPDFSWKTHLHIALESGNLSTYLKSGGLIA